MYIYICMYYPAKYNTHYIFATLCAQEIMRPDNAQEIMRPDNAQEIILTRRATFYEVHPTDTNYSQAGQVSMHELSYLYVCCSK